MCARGESLGTRLVKLYCGLMWHVEAIHEECDVRMSAGENLPIEYVYDLEPKCYSDYAHVLTVGKN